MADSITFSQGGIVNLTGDDRALYLTKFGGMVLKRFDEVKEADKIHQVIPAKPGQKNMQFPATWLASASYHTAGTELLAGNQIRTGQRLIHIDARLLSYVWVDELDEMLSHYHHRQIYAHQIAEAIADTTDQHKFQVMCLAARASAAFTGGDGGTQLQNAAFATSGNSLGAGLFAASQILTEKRIPKRDRYAVFRPAQYNNLVQSKYTNRDIGGSGSVSTGEAPKVSNISIIESNNIPSTDKSGDSTTGHENTYVGDFSSTLGVCVHRSAIGTLMLKNITMGTQWFETYQATILVAKTDQGTGILRPEAAIEFLS